MHALRELRAARGLHRLVAGWALVTLAEWAFVTAVSISAFEQVGALGVGLVGFRFAPAAFAYLAVGSLVERHAGGRLLAAVTSTRAVIVGAAAVALAADAPIGVVLGLVGLDAVLATPYRPAQSVLLPALARTPVEVSAGVTGLSTAKTISQAAGALLGGAVMALASPAAVAAGAVVLLAVTAALTAGIGAVPGRAGREAAATTTRDALRATPALLGDPLAGPIAWASGLRSLVRGLWFALAIVAAFELLGLGEAGLGLLLAAAGVGAATAIPLTFALASRLRLGIGASAGLALCGLPLVVVGLVAEPAVAFGAIAVWGAAMAVADVTTLALLHRLVDAHRLGRAVGAMEAFKLALEGAGALLAPALVAVLGVEAALVAAGLPLPLFVVVAAGRLRAADRAAADRTAVVALLRRVAVFRPLTVDGLEDVASRLVRSTARAGDEVVAQGEAGERFYVIESGSVDVEVGGYPVAQLGAGQAFGERALLRDAPRAATVRARTDLALHALDRDDFHAVVTGRETVAAAVAGTALDTVAALDGVSLLAGLPPASRRALAERATVHRWPPGAALVREGEAGDGLHVVLSGAVTVSVGERAVGDLLPGDSFGEIALIHGTARTATVRASGEGAVTASVGRDALLRQAALPARHAAP